MRMRKLRPSPGVLIGTIALVFALTGAATAASRANKVQTNDLVRHAVTGKKLASNSVKGGKIVDGKVKAKDLAPGVIPEVPDQAYGQVRKNGGFVAPVQGSVGIKGVASGGTGVICYDLDFAPVSGTATVARGGTAAPGSTVELALGVAAEWAVNPSSGCQAPYNDAATQTRTLKREAPAANAEDKSLDEPTDQNVYVHFTG